MKPMKPMLEVKISGGKKPPMKDDKTSDLAPSANPVPGDEPESKEEMDMESEANPTNDPKLDALMDLMRTVKERPELIDPMQAMLTSMKDDDGSKAKAFDEEMTSDIPQSDKDYMEEGNKPRSIGERARMGAMKRLGKL